MDQYVRWQEGAFAEQKEASATSGSGVTVPRSRGAMKMSDIKQHFPKVLAVTMRTGDMEGSLETLQYMSAMGVRRRSHEALRDVERWNGDGWEGVKHVGMQ